MWYLDLLDGFSALIGLYAGLSMVAFWVDHFSFRYQLKKVGVPLKLMEKSSNSPLFLLAKYLHYKNSKEADLNSISQARVNWHKKIMMNALVAFVVMFVWFGSYLPIKELFLVK